MHGLVWPHYHSRVNASHVAADATEKTLGADGCNLFLEREIRCEKHTKHPYHVRVLNNVRSKC